jgi:hypothetical protein
MDGIESKKVENSERIETLFGIFKLSTTERISEVSSINFGENEKNSFRSVPVK